MSKNRKLKNLKSVIISVSRKHLGIYFIIFFGDFKHILDLHLVTGKSTQRGINDRSFKLAIRGMPGRYIGCTR